MPGKWPDQTLEQAFGLPEVLVAVSTSRLSCKRAGKTRTLMPVWDSSGDSRLDSGNTAAIGNDTKLRRAICRWLGWGTVLPSSRLVPHLLLELSHR